MFGWAFYLPNNFRSSEFKGIKNEPWLQIQYTVDSTQSFFYPDGICITSSVVRIIFMLQSKNFFNSSDVTAEKQSGGQRVSVEKSN